MLPLAAGVTALGLCCGIPLLASFGVAGAIVGLSTGSWFLIAFASVAVVVGVIRWRRQRACRVGSGDPARSPEQSVPAAEPVGDGVRTS